MTTPHFDSAAVMGRLERVERQNRWMKRGVAAGLFLAGAVVLMGGQEPPQGKTGESNKLVLRDENGNERAWLGVDKDGPALRFHDDKGKQRLWLGVVKDVPALVFSDHNGKRRAALSVGTDSLHVAFYDGGGRRRGWLVVSEDAAALHLLDREGKQHSGLSVEIDGTAVWQHDKDGKLSIGPNSAMKNVPGIALGGEMADPLSPNSR